MPLHDALRLLVRLDMRFAVVKRGHREIGMIGEQRLREVLEQTDKSYAEETKMVHGEDTMDRYMSWKDKRNVSNGSLTDRYKNDKSSGKAGAYMNRISKDDNGNEISGISKKADASSEFDSNEDVATVSDYIMQYNKDDSLVKTESSNRMVKEEFSDNIASKNLPNRLAQSERVKKTTKTVTIQNYLNNRRSVKIHYSKQHPLKQGLLQSGNEIGEDDYYPDLENPLEP